MPGSRRWLSSNLGHASGYRPEAARCRASLKSMVAAAGSVAAAERDTVLASAAIETRRAWQPRRFMTARESIEAWRRLFATVEEVGLTRRNGRARCRGRAGSGGGTAPRRRRRRGLRAG